MNKDDNQEIANIKKIISSKYNNCYVLSASII